MSMPDRDEITLAQFLAMEREALREFGRSTSDTTPRTDTAWIETYRAWLHTRPDGTRSDETPQQRAIRRARERGYCIVCRVRPARPGMVTCDCRSRSVARL
jgi:hypothetical protein